MVGEFRYTFIFLCQAFPPPGQKKLEYEYYPLMLELYSLHILNCGHGRNSQTNSPPFLYQKRRRHFHSCNQPFQTPNVVFIGMGRYESLYGLFLGLFCYPINNLTFTVIRKITIYNSETIVNVLDKEHIAPNVSLHKRK